jgi:hypothetical protein
LNKKKKNNNRKKRGDEECKGKEIKVENWNCRGGAKGEKENVRMKKRRWKIEWNYKKEQ